MPSTRAKLGIAAVAGGALAVIVWLLIRGGSPADLGEAPASAATKPTSRPSPIVGIAPASSPAAARVAVDSGAGSRRAADATVKRAILLFGNVTDPGGAPIRANVRLENEEDGETLSNESNAIGAYEFTGTKSGSWLATASIFGYHDSRRTITFTAAGEPIHQDFVLEPKIKIPVRLATPDGGRLRDALRAKKFNPYYGRELTVIVTRTPLGGRLRMPTNGSAGLGLATIIADMVRRPDALLAYPDDVDALIAPREPLPLCANLMLGSVVLATQTISPGAAEVRFIVDPKNILDQLGSVTVRVVDDETGLPLANCTLALNSVIGGPLARSGADGVAVRDRASAGRFTVMITEPSHATYIQRIELEPGQRMDIGTIRMKAKATIRGQFVDGAGKAVTCYFRILVSDPRADPGDLRFDMTTKDDGSFFCEVDRSRHWITVQEAGFAATLVEVDTSAGDVDLARVELQRGVPLTIVVPSGLAEWARVTVSDSNDRQVWSRVALPEMPPLHARLVPGTYHISTEDPAGQRRTSTFQIGASALRIQFPN
jgi:hypothetical protein